MCSMVLFRQSEKHMSRQKFWYTSLFARLHLDYKRNIGLKGRFLVAKSAMREEVFVLLLSIIARLVERADAYRGTFVEDEQ